MTIQKNSTSKKNYLYVDKQHVLLKRFCCSVWVVIRTECEKHSRPRSDFLMCPCFAVGNYDTTS